MQFLDSYIDFGSELVTAWRTGPKWLRIVLSAAIILVVILIIVVVVGEIFHFDPKIVEGIAGSLGVTAVLLILGVLAYQKSIRRAAYADRLEKVEKRAEEYPDETKAAWELAQVKLETYLNRNISQVRSIYWLTVIVMVLGFILIGFGVVRLYQDPAALNVSILSAASGVLVNFIGTTFLVIYRSTMSQAKEYVTILERINAVGMAVQILESLKEQDSDLHNQTTAEIAKEMLKMYSTKNTSA